MKISLILILLTPLFALSKSYQVGEFWSEKHISKAPRWGQILKESVGEVATRAILFGLGPHFTRHLS